MNTADRKTLEYLQNHEWIALGAILAECTDATEQGLTRLHKKGYVEFRKYVGNGDFYKPTDKGQRALLPFSVNASNYVARNLIALISLVLIIVGIIVTLVK